MGHYEGNNLEYLTVICLVESSGREKHEVAGLFDLLEET